jgi:hypothetical protein
MGHAVNCVQRVGESRKGKVKRDTGKSNRRHERLMKVYPVLYLRLNCFGHLLHTRRRMRRLTALQACMAMVFAFFMAPYQHVHSGQCDGRGSRGVFENSTVVHAHPFVFSHVHTDVASLPHGSSDGTRVEESSDEHASWWLNNSSLVLHSALLLFALPKSADIPWLTADSFSVITIVEERGHDPPPLDCSVPRAPPA